MTDFLGFKAEAPYNQPRFYSIHSNGIKRTGRIRDRRVSKKDTVEYANQQKRIRKMIESLTLEKALDLGVLRRAYFDLKKKIKNKISFTIKKRTLRKLLKLQLFLISTEV